MKVQGLIDETDRKAGRKTRAELRAEVEHTNPQAATAEAEAIEELIRRSKAKEGNSAQGPSKRKKSKKQKRANRE